jgi:hypothetical protein
VLEEGVLNRQHRLFITSGFLKVEHAAFFAELAHEFAIGREHPQRQLKVRLSSRRRRGEKATARMPTVIRIPITPAPASPTRPTARRPIRWIVKRPADTVCLDSVGDLASFLGMQSILEKKPDYKKWVCCCNACVGLPIVQPCASVTDVL